MKTLIISSSISKKSKSFILCNKMEALLKKLDVEVKLIDLRQIDLKPTHIDNSNGMDLLAKDIENYDNIIIGMGIHCYSINDSLKIILDNCFSGAKDKFFGILCAAGGDRSYLSTIHLTQICMNEFRMLQLPRIVYATGRDFNENNLLNLEITERLDEFSKEFFKIGTKLLN